MLTKRGLARDSNVSLGFGLTPLSAERRGYMPPLLKTKQKQKNYADYFMIFFEMEKCGYLSLDFQVQNFTFCMSKIIFFLIILA